MNLSAAALKRRCTELLEKRKFADAISMLSEDVQKRSGLVRPLTLASECCIKLGWYEEAADLAAAGITLDPSADPAWYNAAQSLVKLGKPGEAGAVLKQAPERVRARAVLPGSGFGKVDGVAFLSFQTQEPSKLVWKGLDRRATVEAMRNLGWQEWKNGNYEASLKWWKSLIHRKASDVGNSLLMRSLCNLQHKQSSRALMDVTTAMMLDTVESKNVHLEILSHRQAVLEAMEHHNAAEKMAVFAQSLKGQMDFEKKSIHMKEANHPTPGKTSQDDKFRAFGYEVDKNEDNGADVDQMVRIIPDLMRQNLADDRVAPFYKEFVLAPPLPKSNLKTSLKLLKGWYVSSALCNASSLRKQQSLSASNDSGQLMARLSPNPVNYKKWWDAASIGDINARSPFVVYPDDVYQTFSNVVPKSITLRFGEKHVAVGYVDMSILLWANIVGDEAAGPLEFVGYEMSAYATSRTHVLAQMLRDGAHVDSILQVGYSSGWSFTCLNEFREAVNKVLEKGELAGFAKNILLHWKDAPNVSLLESQEKWQDLHCSDRNVVANLVRKEDRLAVMHYLLSGRLLHCDVGSITMFGNPPKIPHVAREEAAYWTLSAEELGENYKSCGSFMGVLVGGLRKRVTRLRDLMHRGLVSVDLRIRHISVGDPKGVQEIRDMNPTSMSWSNVGDFMPLEAFHAVASMCSTSNTVHHLHSMNWVRDIKGTFLVDYAGNERIALAQQGYTAAAEYMRESIGEGIFHIPPITSPECVAPMVALQFSKKWCSHFTRAGGLYNARVNDFCVTRYAPFNHSPTAHIALTYSNHCIRE